VIAVLGLAACDDELGEAECRGLGHDYRFIVVSATGKDEYVLESGGGYTAMHTHDDGTPFNCVRDVARCETSDIDTLDLRTNFNRPAVTDAFAASRSYGSGTDFTIERDDGERIQLGAACNRTAGCVEAPAEIAALRSLLEQLIDQQEPNGPATCTVTDIDASVADGGSDSSFDACVLEQGYELYFEDALDGGLNSSLPQYDISMDGSVMASVAGESCVAQLSACVAGEYGIENIATVAHELAVAFESGVATFGSPDQNNNYFVIRGKDGRRVRIGGCASPACSTFPESVAAARALSSNLPIGRLPDGGTAGMCQ
jgi:hypothetical protein